MTCNFCEPKLPSPTLLEVTTKEEKMEILRLSDVPLQEVKWLWYPYIPFGKITIIQGDPGEGKTTLALRLAAACTTGQALPGMEVPEPFNVIYQTAEDAAGRLIQTGGVIIEPCRVQKKKPGASE